MLCDGHVDNRKVETALRTKNCVPRSAWRAINVYKIIRYFNMDLFFRQIMKIIAIGYIRCAPGGLIFSAGQDKILLTRIHLEQLFSAERKIPRSSLNATAPFPFIKVCTSFYR